MTIPPHATRVSYIDAWGLKEIAPGLFMTEALDMRSSQNPNGSPDAPVYRHTPRNGVDVREFSTGTIGNEEDDSLTTRYVALSGAHVFYINIKHPRDIWATCEVINPPLEVLKARGNG